MAKSLEKLKTTIAITLMDFKCWAIKLPKSHVHRTCSIITLSVLIRSFQLLQTLEKNISNFFGCLSTVSNTTWLENHVVFMFLKSLSLILQLLIPLFKSLITVIIRTSSNLNSECNHYLQIRIC